MRARPARSRTAIAALLTLLFTSVTSIFANAVLGIDLSQEYIKAALRKEVSAIGFKPAPRDSMGEFIYPKQVYAADAVNLSARFPDNILPSPYGSTLEFWISAAPLEEYSDGKFTVEELLAMQLKDIVGNAEAMAGSKIKKVMFTILPYFTAEEKYALNLAAELAGLKVMTLVMEGLAVGINYATSRTFNESSDPCEAVPKNGGT
ncbi:lumenal Hsp70 protein [Rhizina undulata]